MLLFAGAGLLPASAAERGFSCDFMRVLRQAGRLGTVAEALVRRRALSVLAIGSSSTEGVGASSPDSAYPSRFRAAMAARWPRAEISVVNAGIGGEMAPRTLERLEEALRDHHYDLVVWQLGTNDALRGETPEGLRAYLDKGVHAARAAGADIVLVDPQYFPGIRNQAAYDAVVESIGKVAADERVPVFSRYAMMKAWSARSEDDLLAGLAGDRFHMNDTGYDCVGRGLALHVSDMARMGAAVAATR